jgi:hypothetical protein
MQIASLFKVAHERLPAGPVLAGFPLRSRGVCHALSLLFFDLFDETRRDIRNATP